MSSYDLQEKSDHGKKEQIQKASGGEGQTARRQEERREKESRGGEGQEERRTQGCKKGGESCAQEGEAQGRQEGNQAGGGAKSRSARGSGTDACAGYRHADGGPEHGTVGVLDIRRGRN
ncbi:MAG TPA: hypothetical protein VKH13_12800 [Steroidobacteraceae bacterium]|nr:hypothetical protein [Steroidobacteraceae bacterium]